MTGRAAPVALIGSPYQLLSLFEAINASVITQPPVVILQGQVDGYRAVLDAGRSDLADVVEAGSTSRWGVLRRLRSAQPLILGDPFSVLGHLALATGASRPVVLLEDGAAAFAALRSVAHGRRALVRAHERRRWPRPLAALARRAIVRATAVGVHVVHSLPHDDSVVERLHAAGFSVAPHRFEWTREKWCQPDGGADGDHPMSGHVVLGSSLVADGFVDHSRYAAWLEQILARDVVHAGRVAFAPHRRERPDVLHRVASMKNVSIVRDDLPMEPAAARWCPAHVTTLPSTAALTVSIVSPDTEVECQPVPASWWRPGVPDTMTALMDEIVSHCSAGGERTASAAERGDRDRRDTLRRVRRNHDGPDPHAEITAVWDGHEDETYRQDQSHWRGVGRWDDEQWANLGVATRRRVHDLYHTARRRLPADERPVMLEWGPGGGANLHAMADATSLMYGIDISAKNLEEASRVVAERNGASFVPIHLTGEPDSIVERIDRPIDLFVSTAVFQHFPSKEYGRDVLRVACQLLAPQGLGYVQIRFDNGNPKYAPKPLTSYRKSHITANSYELSEFWDCLDDAGFRPLKIANVNTKNNYASFFFVKRA